MSTVRHKTLSLEDALQYIAFAVWHKDLPDDFDGDITCELNEDGSVEVYATDAEVATEPNSKISKNSN
jgi:hypothetical protein